MWQTESAGRTRSVVQAAGVWVGCGHHARELAQPFSSPVQQNGSDPRWEMRQIAEGRSKT